MNGMPLDRPFGRLIFSQSISGFGEKGISVGSFEFDVYDRYGIYSQALLKSVPVRLLDPQHRHLPSKTYYIAERSVTNGVCRFTAYDIMSKTETEFDITQLNVFFSRGEKAPCGNVLDIIKELCGFENIYCSSEGLDRIYFTKDMLEGKSCADVLEMISEAMCGVWIADRNGNAVLSCLGENQNLCTLPISSSGYSRINYHGKQKITSFICTNSLSDTRKSLRTGEYGTVISAESPFLANGSGLEEIVWNRINGYIYSSWSCDKAIVDDIAGASEIIGFSDKLNLWINNSKVKVDNTGIYFSGGTKPMDDEQWRYEEYLSREIREHVRYNKTAGNIRISKGSGIQFINKNKTSAISAFSENDNDIEKYGFDVQSQGVTTYSGAMLDSVFPDLEINDDATELTADYGGTVKKYKLTWDGDTKLSMSEIKEENL